MCAKPEKCDESDEFIYCTMCVYKAKRKDHFDRHMKQKHFKITKTCECGRKVQGSGLSKHKKKHCSLRRPAPSQRLNASTEIFDPNVSSASSVSSDSTKASSYLISSVVHRIETNVRVNTYTDGDVVIVPGELKIGNEIFVITKKVGVNYSGKWFIQTIKWIEFAMFLFTRFR